MLSVPGCPNHAIAMTRIIEAIALAGVSGAAITERVITDDAEAHTLGMHGSPTILIDGHDPFIEAGTHPSMSCRLYRTPAGLEGAPSVTELIAAVTHAR